VLGDVGRGRDVGEQRVDALDAPAHVGLGEDGTQPTGPFRQLADLGRADVVGGPVVVAGQDVVNGVRGGGGTGVDEGDRELRRRTSVRVELH
jgi:hypothetical protein